MIQNSAVLVDLNISVWTGRKMDKKVSDEIGAVKNAKANAGNYHKKLLAGTDRLDDLQKLVSAIRIWHYEQTLPWSDNGSRLLPQVLQTAPCQDMTLPTAGPASRPSTHRPLPGACQCPDSR